MECKNFILVFDSIIKELELPEYLKEICLQVRTKSMSREKIDEVLFNYNINVSVAKVDFLYLIVEYIRRSLEDNILTQTEKTGIQLLKKLFKIQHGDFYYHNKEQIEQIITYQLSKIYNDNVVSKEEALLKVDLQEVFDLSFDQINEYSKKYAAILIREGVDPVSLDVFFTNNEFFKLKYPH